jgi:hypothetical protein
MNSHNAKLATAASKAPVQVNTDLQDVQVLRSSIKDDEGLTIADDFDIGGDPYNSTGAHCIIKSDKNRQK